MSARWSFQHLKWLRKASIKTVQELNSSYPKFDAHYYHILRFLNGFLRRTRLGFDVGNTFWNIDLIDDVQRSIMAEAEWIWLCISYIRLSWTLQASVLIFCLIIWSELKLAFRTSLYCVRWFKIWIDHCFMMMYKCLARSVSSWTALYDV